MCGICGIISPRIDKSDREQRLTKMNEAIFHRGPDELGFFSNKNCSLAMRRLSIIDLNTGKQPLYSSDKRFLIFFNGEIYNYRELKLGLLKKGYVFTTSSDTEVVVNLYAEYGKEGVVKLEGMFAFCIYDQQENSYFFARDRFGEKPFYYNLTNGCMLFSSEIASLLSGNLFTPRLNHDQLGSYIRLGYVAEPNTLIKDVFALPAGHWMFLDREFNIKVENYFHIRYTPDPAIKSLEDAACFIKPHFENAVRKQMISDVPIGSFLSGGVDSSSVVAVMSKLAGKPIKTFTVKFQTKGYDESQIAKKVAERYNTEHHEIVVSNSQFAEEQFWRILDHVGLPFPDSSAIPTDMVTREIAKYVKVALSGDGGDEVFGGYTVFDWLRKMRNFGAIPASVRNGLKTLIQGTNRTLLNNNKLRQLSKVLSIAGQPLGRMIQETHALIDSEEFRALMRKEGEYIEVIDFDPADSLLRSAMRYRIKYDLTLDMLIKVDRMSMANSLEVRSPFLDPLLFDASCRLPDRFLRSGGIGKLVVREMMKTDLPVEVFNHPKSGFSIPMHDFRNKAFIQLAYDLLHKSYMQNIFSKEAITNILYAGTTDSADSASGSIYRKTHQLWSLMMLSGWIEKYKIEL